MTAVTDDSFELYDLRVEVVAPEGARLYCGAKPGDCFELRGEMLYLPPGQGISIYSLAAILPLLPAKQRLLHPNDWMSTDAEIACPDPNCPSRLRITRLAKRRFNHAGATAVPFEQGSGRVTMRNRVELRPGYWISPVIRGAWQLAGGHGVIDRNEAVRNLEAAYIAGITTFDCADIYTGVEDLLGEFRNNLLNSAGAQAVAQLKIHTKFVPDLDLLPIIRKADVSSTIERSLRRLRIERLDLVQYHWWDYDVPGCIEVALWLKDLQREGKIDLIGGTNFDAPHAAKLIDAGVPLVSMQVQYSLIDARPEHGLSELCRKHDLHLLCYGTVAGGFLSDAWLGKDEPQPPFENRSLTKYKLVIDDFGGWDLFQDLLHALRAIAGRHAVDIATVASRAVLARPQVAALIVGARNLAHLPANIAIINLDLTARDLAEIDAVLSRRLGPEGDVFTLERDRFGRHGSIMKYNLARQAS